MLLLAGTGTNACYMEDTAKIDKWKNNDSSNQVNWTHLFLNACLVFFPDFAEKRDVNI